MIKEKYLADVTAGGLIFRKIKGKYFFVAVFRKLFNDLRPPAGHPRKGEDLGKTAQREALEETGFKTKPVKFLMSTNYSFLGDFQNGEGLRKKLSGFQILKTVHWFLLEYAGGHKSLKDKMTDQVAWLLFPQGIKDLTYAEDQLVTKKAWLEIKKLSKAKK